MHIIIDGYNLIRQSDSLRHLEKYGLKRGRMALIEFLSSYKKHRDHTITVVFDGWEGGSPREEREKTRGINIIYSRRDEKADDVIKRMVVEAAGEILVVTSDRNVADFVNRRRGKTAITSYEFEQRVTKIITMSLKGDYSGKHSSERDSPSFSSACHEKDKDEDETMREHVKKKGSSRRLSRKEKDLILKLRKI